MNTSRAIAFSSRRGPALGASVGFKRRLDRASTPGNAWDTGYSSFFAGHEPAIYGACFKLDQYTAVKTLMRQVLRGVDQGVLANRQVASQNSWWPNRQA